MFDGTGQRYKDSNYGGVWTNLEDRRAMAIVHARQDLEADFPGHFVLIHEWRGGRSITILSEQPANSTMRLHFEMPTMQIFMNTVGYDCLIFKDAEVVYHGERGTNFLTYTTPSAQENQGEDLKLAFRRPAVDPANWMGAITDPNTLLTALSIPGTHDSHAVTGTITAAVSGGGPLGAIINGVGAPWIDESGACHAEGVDKQLLSGVRYVDLRCAYDDHGNLQMRHGKAILPGTLFTVVDQIATFLASHPGECVLVNVKWDKDTLLVIDGDKILDSFKPKNVSKALNEGKPAGPQGLDYMGTWTGAPDGFGPDLVKSLRAHHHGDKWYFGTTLPKLGECRGKMLLLHAFKDTPDGIFFDHDGVTGPPLRVQATQWTPGLVPEQVFPAVQTNLESAVTSPIDPATLYLSWCSGEVYSEKGISPQDFAKVMLPLVSQYLEKHRGLRRRFGIVVMDFEKLFGNNILETLIASNFN